MDNDDDKIEEFCIPDEILAIALPEGYEWGTAHGWFFGVLNIEFNWWEWFWYTDKATMYKPHSLYNQEIDNSQTKLYGIIPNPIEAAQIMAAHIFLNITIE